MITDGYILRDKAEAGDVAELLGCSLHACEPLGLISSTA